MWRAIAIVAFGVLGIGAARADTGDFHTGKFDGLWCGYGVTFNIDSKEAGDRWVFNGTIFFPSYKQYDRLWIEQYGDNSLRMIRYLSGPGAGQTQVVQTYPPAIRQGEAGVYADFQVQTANGPDCEGKVTHFELR